MMREDDDIYEQGNELLLLLDKVDRLLDNNQTDEAMHLLTTVDDEAYEEDPAMMVMASSLYQRLGMSDYAYRWVKQMITAEDADEDPFMADILAECCSLLGKYDEAVEYYDKMLDEDPYNCEYWLFLAETQCRQSLYLNALESCEFAQVADKENVFASDIHYVRGICCEALGDKEQAFIEYKQSACLGRFSLLK